MAKSGVLNLVSGESDIYVIDKSSRGRVKVALASLTLNHYVSSKLDKFYFHSPWFVFS